jgi:hypothetical protein
MFGVFALSSEPNSKDRRFIATMVGIAAAVSLGLILFALVSDFPGPSPAGDDKVTSDSPPEDVRR